VLSVSDVSRAKDQMSEPVFIFSLNKMLFCYKLRFKCWLSSTDLKKFCKGFKSEPKRKYDVIIIGGGRFM
jgi:hypothetical protein